MSHHGTLGILSILCLGIGILNGCDRIRSAITGRTTGGPEAWDESFPTALPAEPKLAPATVEVITKNRQLSGVSSDAGVPFPVGNCVLSLAAGNVTCDFGFLAYDSNGTRDGKRIFIKRPASLHVVDGKNLVVADGVTPEQVLVAQSDGKHFVPVDPQSGFRSVELNKDGTYTAYLDGQGTDVTKTFDASRRLVREIDPTTRAEILYTYDAVGNFTGKRSPDQTILVSYDAENRLEGFSDGKNSLKFADKPDSMTVTKDGKPVLIITKVPDAKDMAKSIAYGDAEVTFTYESGRVGSVVGRDGGGATVIREGQRVTVKHPSNGNVLYVGDFENGLLASSKGPNGGQKIQRDAYGRPVSLEGLDGRRTAIRYDDSGRVVALANVKGVGVARIFKTVAYNGFGQVVARMENRSRMEAAYDDHGRLVSQVEWEPGLKRVFRVEKHDAVGRPLSVHEEATKVESKTSSLAYDASGKVLTKTEDDGISKSNTNWDVATGSLSMDALDRLGGSRSYKKMVNPMDNSTTEVEKVIDHVGRIREVTVASTREGSKKIEANESAVLTTQVFDTNGKLRSFTSLYTTDPTFAWAADATAKAATTNGQSTTSPTTAATVATDQAAKPSVEPKTEVPSPPASKAEGMGTKAH